MAEKVTIARPYAQAIFELARETGELAQWSDMLALAAAVASNEEMVAVIASPNLTRAQVTELFIGVCGEGLNEAGRNAIRILAENDRLAFLREVAELFEVARAEAEGSIQAEVVSATVLNEAQQAAIAQALKTRLGREVTLNCTIDASLVGGAVIRAGDVVIDGSVTGKLEKLATRLMQ